MRMNNDRDQAYVRNAMPEGAEAFLAAIPALRNRECVISGEGVTLPLRVQLDTLEPEKRPASDDPVFSRSWTQEEVEADLVSRTVRAWRSQSH